MADIHSKIIIDDGFSNPLTLLGEKFRKVTNSASGLKNQLGRGLKPNIPTSSVDNLNNKLNTTKGLFNKLVGANVIGAGITKGISSISNGINSMIGELDESSKAWQTFQGNMQMNGHSLGQINAAKSDMQKFAQDTIYSSSDMASAYAQFDAVGTKHTGNLVKGLGGLAAASSDPTQAMKTLSQQSVQAAAKPKLQWQDFRLMLEQTPAGMAQVAKTMGKSTQELIQDVQAGTVKTKDFFNAVSKTGTNKQFSKMARSYKTVGQAMDGLRETVANKTQPAFDKLSKIGINAISGIADKVDTINFDKMADKIIPVAKSIMKYISNTAKFISGAFSNIWNGLKNTEAFDSVKNALSSLGKMKNKVFTSLTGSGDAFSGFSVLGKLAGGAIKIAANSFKYLSDIISNFNPAFIKAISISLLSIYGAMKLFKVVAGIPEILLNMAIGLEALAGMPSKLSQIPTMISEIGRAFQMLALSGVEVSLAFWPITLIVLGVTALIAGAIWAWNDNFLGFRDVVQSVFSNMGSIFAPFVSALQSIWNAVQQVGQALKPVAMQIMPLFADALKLISVGMIMAIAIAISLFADVLVKIVAVGSAVVHTIGAIANGMDALYMAITGNFSGAKAALSDAKTDIEGVGTSIQKVFSGKTITGNLFSQFGKIGQTAKNTENTVNNTKLSPQINTGNVFTQMDSISNKKIKGPQISSPTMSTTNPFAQIEQQTQNKTIPGPKVGKPQIQKDDISSQFNSQIPKTITAPKVNQPKVPQPKIPKINQTIPAPKVKNPNMDGVVNAVKQGMERAVNAARSARGAMQQAGSYVGQGLANGIRSQISNVASAADSLVAQAERVTRAKAKIHSPSRLFNSLGDYVGQGFANGMTGTTNLVQNASMNMNDAAINGINTDSKEKSPFQSNTSNSNATYATTNNSNYSQPQSTSVDHSINISNGAIQIISSGNEQIDGNKILSEIEKILKAKKQGGIGYGYE